MASAGNNKSSATALVRVGGRCRVPRDRFRIDEEAHIPNVPRTGDSVRSGPSVGHTLSQRELAAHRATHQAFMALEPSFMVRASADALEQRARYIMVWHSKRKAAEEKQKVNAVATVAANVELD